MKRAGTVLGFAVGAVYDRALYWTGFEAYRIKRAVIDRAYRRQDTSA